MLNLKTFDFPNLLTFDEGDLVDAVVPFMGESITDGTLATFLKSMFSTIVISIHSLAILIFTVVSA